MMPEIDEVDILQKEMEGQNFVQEAQVLTNQIDGRMTPNKPMYLETIRRGLEAAGPSSVPPQMMNTGGAGSFDPRPGSSHNMGTNPFATN
jgi:hypothetical protein